MGKNLPANAGDIKVEDQNISFDPWVGKIPWRRACPLILVFLPGESHAQSSLAGYGL